MSRTYGNGLTAFVAATLLASTSAAHAALTTPAFDLTPANTAS